MTSLLLALVPTAMGYVITTTDSGEERLWQTMPIYYEVNLSGDHGLSDGEIQTMVAAGFRVWQDVPDTEISFTDGGTTSIAVGDYEDEVQAIYFESDWVESSELMGFTYVWFTGDGEIIGADIPLNTANYTWDTEGTPDSADLLNVMSHEVGHALGLGHSLDEDATMFAETSEGETKKRDLHEDDEAAVQYLYPPREDAPEDAEDKLFWFCSSTQASPSWLALPVLIMACIRRRSIHMEGSR